MLLRTLTAVGGCALPTAVVSAELAAGPWGGDRVRLVVDDRGAKLETDCASGSIQGPIEVGASGAFVAKGSFVQHIGGPQAADAAPRAGTAQFSGQIEGDTMRLSIMSAGAPSAQQFTLRRGAVVKLVRCL